MTNFKKSFWHKSANSISVTADMLPADFHESEILNVDFSGLDLSDSNFANAKIKDCSFRNCNLTGVSFFDAELDNCDFVGAKICTNKAVASWQTRFPKDISKCIFDEKGIKSLKELDAISKDAEQKWDIWEKNHPIRHAWEPNKLDSPWN